MMSSGIRVCVVRLWPLQSGWKVRLWPGTKDSSFGEYNHTGPNTYLRHLPVDEVKIDGQFVRDLCRDPVDLAMVRSINEVAHILGKRTVAEWVEDGAVLEKLRELGVDYAQGRHVGEPLPLDRILRTHRKAL